MFYTVQIEDLQKVTGKNFRDFGAYPKVSFDTYTADLFGSSPCFVGFPMVNAGGGQLRVGNGRLYVDGKGYIEDTAGGSLLSLLDLLPTTLKKWAVIYATGEEVDDDVQPTTFLTDTTNRVTTSRRSAQRKTRRAFIRASAPGTPSGDPAKPITPSGAVPIGYALLSPNGIDAVEVATDFAAPNTQAHAARFKEYDVWRYSTTVKVGALGSNIAAIQERLKDTPTGAIMRQVAKDVANVKELLRIPDGITSYSLDHFLDNSGSAVNHVDYLARVEEGIRFPFAQQREAQIALANPLDASVFKSGDTLWPNFTENPTLNSLDQQDTEAQISSFPYQAVTYEQKSMTRARLRVGPWYQTCTNWLNYFRDGATYDALTGVLKLTSGEVFQVFPEDQYLGGVVDTHLPIRLRQVWQDGFEDVAYTDVKTQTIYVNGSTCGNTFVSPQDGWVSSLDLMFTKLGQSGEVGVLLCETTEGGEPNYSKILGSTIMPFNDLRLAPTKSTAYFRPMVFLKKGTRYGFILWTPGAHAVAQSIGNKMGSGTFFYSTDNRWAIGDLDKDICFSLNFAKFDNVRLELQLAPLQLENGIANIDILSEQVIPSGASLEYYAQFNGVWVNLATIDPDNSELVGLPPLVQFKAVFTGTVDVMPCLGVGAKSRVVTSRPRSDFRHISTIRQTPQVVNQIEIETRLEAWRGVGHHVCTVKLMTGDINGNGGTIVNPTAETTEVAPDDITGGTVIRKSVFQLAAPINAYRVRREGTTDNVLTTFHVAEHGDYATMTT